MDIPRKGDFGTLQVDLDGKIVFACVNFSNIVERPLERLIGQPIFRFIAARERTFCQRKFEQMVLTRVPLATVKQFVTPSGVTVPTLTNACLLRDAEGQPCGVISIEQRLSGAAVWRVTEELPRARWLKGAGHSAG